MQKSGTKLPASSGASSDGAHEAPGQNSKLQVDALKLALSTATQGLLPEQLLEQGDDSASSKREGQQHSTWKYVRTQRKGELVSQRDQANSDAANQQQQIAGQNSRSLDQNSRSCCAAKYGGNSGPSRSPYQQVMLNS